MGVDDGADGLGGLRCVWDGLSCGIRHGVGAFSNIL